MSTENVDRVRAAIDALNGSGWDPDAVIPHFDPGAVHYPFPDWPGLEALQQHGRARGSGVPAETEVSAVFSRIGPNGIGETRYWFGWEP